MSSEWIKEITLEELPGNYQEMVQVILETTGDLPTALQITIKLGEYYNKQGFYFSLLDKLIAKKKADFIKKYFNGRNHCELARATGYSERWVYAILKGVLIDKQQVDMFETGT